MFEKIFVRKKFGRVKPQSKIRVANDCQNPIFKMFLKIPSKIIVHINIIKGATKW